jgi:hypothetical protein
MAHVVALPRPEGLMQGEVATSSRFSPTLLSNKIQKEFQTIKRRSDGHHARIRKNIAQPIFSCKPFLYVVN